MIGLRGDSQLGSGAVPGANTLTERYGRLFRLLGAENESSMLVRAGIYRLVDNEGFWKIGGLGPAASPVAHV